MRHVICAALFAAGIALPGGATRAESGRIGNLLDVEVGYSVGVPDASGQLQWTQHKLAPCEVQEWTWDLAEGVAGLGLGWPLWIDARKDEYGNVIGTGSLLPLNAEGTAISAFFRYGDQVWLDSSGNAAASMAACQPPPAAPGADAAAVAPQTDPGASPAEVLSAFDALVARIERGEVLLVEVNGRILPVAVQDMTILLHLRLAAGEMDLAEMSEFIDLMARQSKILLRQTLDAVAFLRAP
jgi:hypothetical protein